MIRLRKEQIEALRQAKLKSARKVQTQAFRDQGIEADEDPQTGDILMEDAAGGTARLAMYPGGAAVTSGEERTLEVENDPEGEVKAITGSAGLRVSFKHDEEKRLTEIRRGRQNAFTMEYDEQGKLTKMAFPDGATTLFEYDAGRLAAFTDGNGNKTRYGYSQAGLTTRLTDPLGNRIQFEYGEWDSPSKIILPDGGRYEFEYGPDGYLARMLENVKQHATFRFDQDAGTYDVEYADGTKARFVFDGDKIVEAANETCTVKLEYDDEGRVLREETDGRAVEYIRDELGNLVGLVTPDEEKLTFERDKEHRVRKITDWAGGVYRIDYLAVGAFAGIKYPNGTSVSLTATPMGLPGSLLVKSPRSPGLPVASYRWEYDECDRVVSETADDGGRRYSYDKEGRLLGVEGSGPGLSESFELDANGNRVKDSAGECTFNPLNQLVRRGSQAYTYDGLGNMTAGQCPTGQASYAYNGRNQLLAAETRSGRTRYAYDAFGRRVRKESRGKTTSYVWAGQQLLSETTTEGEKTTRRDYLTFPEQPFPLAMRVGGEVYCLHTGRRFEPLCMTDAAGNIVWQARYGAFGQAEVVIDTVPQPWRLAGQYFDDETGLHYCLARYYNPEFGRYLSMDPLFVEGGSFNFYVYCGGDPLNRLDPTGEFVFTAALGIAVGVGAIIGAAVGGYKDFRKRKENEGKRGRILRVLRGALVGGAIGAGSVLAGGAAIGAMAAAAATGGAATAGVVALGGAVTGGTGSVATQCYEMATGEQKTVKGFVLDAVFGATVGGVLGVSGGYGAGLLVNKAELFALATEPALQSASTAASIWYSTKAARKGAKAGEMAARGKKPSSASVGASVATSGSEQQEKSGEDEQPADEQAKKSTGEKSAGSTPSAGQDAQQAAEVPEKKSPPKKPRWWRWRKQK